MTSFSSVFGSSFIAQPVSDQPNSFDLIPNGKYPMEIQESELATSRAGDPMLKLTFAVTEGKYVNRKIFANLCIGHKSDKVRQIALDQLSQLLMAVGMPSLDEDSQLIGKRFVGRVGIERSKDDRYGDSNRVYQFAPLDAAPAAASLASAPAAAPAARNVPWGRR